MPNWFKKLLELVGIEDLTLEEVIPINYSYNNYNPHSPIIKRNKVKLKKQLLKKKISYKQYSAMCTAMKSGFKYQSFVDVSPDEFSNKTIVGSSFAQREPKTNVFPDGVVNCTLRRCVAFNAIIPTGFTLENTRNEQIKKQNDMECWVVDKDLKPLKPLNEKLYDEFGLSKKPGDIPVVPMDESIVAKAYQEKVKQDRKKLIISTVNDPDKFNALIEKGNRI